MIIRGKKTLAFVLKYSLDLMIGLVITTLTVEEDR